MYPIRPQHRHGLGGVLALLLAVSGCCLHQQQDEIPCYPAAGLMGETYVSTCTDSTWAQYYLNNYRNNIQANPRVDADITAARASLPPGFPSRGQLQALSHNFSPDFATLLLAEKLVYEDPYAEPYRTFFEEEMLRIQIDPCSEPIDVPHNFKDMVLVVVPGAFWESKPELNGDFGIQRQYLAQFGWKSFVVRTQDVGVVEQNACLVANAIRCFRQQGQQIVLFSASRGGAEVYHALGRLLSPAETTHVRGWVNVVGTPRGTPLANEFSDPPLRCLTKLILWAKHIGAIDAVDSLRTDVRRADFACSRPPDPHLAVVNYVAVPLSGHIGEGTEDGYKRLRKYGPNDGVTLVIDDIIHGHPTISTMGYDHHLKEPDQRQRSLAMLRALFRYMHWRDTYGLGQEPLVKRPLPESLRR